MNVLICAGGTGGHVFPALAVAVRLRELGHVVTWMGAPDSFESKRVPEAGFPIELVRVSGLRGKGALKLFAAPLLLLRALRDAFGVLQKVQPDVVLGMGGFAAGPGGLAAWIKRTPLVIHEQNAAAGLTNRLLARIATTVLQAFPNTFKGKAQTVGNPVRVGFAELPAPAIRLAREGRARLLVVGGSQGAKALNEIVPRALALIPATERPEVRHQAGRTLTTACAAYIAVDLMSWVDDLRHVQEFIADMPYAYEEADLVICRSGASTIAELSAAGCASLLVPFPFAVDDHQTANARYLADAGAALLIPERELTPQRLADELQRLLADRAALIRMGEAARAKAWVTATDEIVKALLAAPHPPSPIPASRL
ncbi:MAG: undecaprenyldiphospho-muramoylpentapeptide beta-N-acetylglucosaminyltransferase, partial [Stagnimonas sp.]|nr:undecaprenyldiphospho-muramoylpentapeptide beta-N-acetylglucosaminyltransferase [Stagnimonas sp.]